MTDPDPFARAVSASRLRLRARSAFFATLLMQVEVLPSHEVKGAATDGDRVYLHPDTAATLPGESLDALLLHEVLHAALAHVPRRGPREGDRWNRAADAVVNGLVSSAGLPVPEGSPRLADLEHLSVEEVYATLGQEDRQDDGEGEGDGDLLDGPPSDVPQAGKGRPSPGELEARWRQAVAQADAVARMSGQGDSPLGLSRDFGHLRPARLDWRTQLWRFMARTPVDFAGFDRRFIGRGLYLETLDDESLRVLVGVDTSGSVDEASVTALIAEVRGILGAYPHVRATLYYADTEAYGPYDLGPASDIPPVQGGGGTDFRPLLKLADAGDADVMVYLTDGFGDFPERAPRVPVLWAVTPGGLDSAQFPFGEVARIGEDA